MALLRDDEIRRLLKFLGSQIQDSEKFVAIEDEMRGDFGAEFLREPDILAFFPAEIIELADNEVIWKLKVISYTRLRMIQRGIKLEAVEKLFEKFLQHCAENNLIINVGAYTIFGKPALRASSITLRIDVDEVSDFSGKAHTVTIFIGRGDSFETEEILLS